MVMFRLTKITWIIILGTVIFFVFVRSEQQVLSFFFSIHYNVEIAMKVTCNLLYSQTSIIRIAGDHQIDLSVKECSNH